MLKGQHRSNSHGSKLAFRLFSCLLCLYCLNSVVVLQLPKLLELVGLGYTAWFVYRYLLFKVSNSLPTAGHKLDLPDGHLILLMSN